MYSYIVLYIGGCRRNWSSWTRDRKPTAHTVRTATQRQYIIARVSHLQIRTVAPNPPNVCRASCDAHHTHAHVVFIYRTAIILITDVYLLIASRCCYLFVRCCCADRDVVGCRDILRLHRGIETFVQRLRVRCERFASSSRRARISILSTHNLWRKTKWIY